jgi:uncharacterized protein YraI
MERLFKIGALVVLLAMGVMGGARAGTMSGYSGVNLNIRSGPSAKFPAVGVLGAGSELTIHGCVKEYRWCDISASGMRGWASGAHIQFLYENRRVYVPAYAAQVEIPIVTFHVSDYWNTYYRDYSFYSEYDRWSDYHWWDDDYSPGWRSNWDDSYEGHEY